MQLLVFLFLVLVFFLVRSRLSVDKPGALQHIFEGPTASSRTRATKSLATAAQLSRLS